jgi:diacylglycerol kinase family enzyme
VTRRYHVFVNADAGSVTETEQQTKEITDRFREAAVDATVTAVDPELLADAMRDVWESGTDAIVIAGGDGTVNCAAGVAVEVGMVLGVLPMGTFNHFAKDLGVPQDLAAAVEYLADAPVEAIDVGEVNGTVFVNNASIGVYPKMVGLRDAIRERHGWGKVRAVPVAVIGTLRRLPTHRLRLTIDDNATVTVATPFLFVGNGLFDQHGERLGKRTSLADHRLGVYVIATNSRLRLIANAITARVRGIDAAGATDRRAAEGLVVDSDDGAVEIALDGEPTELRVPLHFRSRAGALRVLATSTDRNGD